MPTPGRIRVVSRPGLEEFAGPSRADRVVARWLPAIAPLLFQALDRAGLHLAPLFYFLAALVLVLSARAFINNGLHLGMLGPIQFWAAILATAFLGLYVASGEDWQRFSGTTALMSAYVAYVFNLVGSFLPR